MCFPRIAGSEASGCAVDDSVVLLFHQSRSPQVAIKEVIPHFPRLNRSALAKLQRSLSHDLISGVASPVKGPDPA